MAFLQRWLDRKQHDKMAAKTAEWPSCVGKVHEAYPDEEDPTQVSMAYSYEAAGEFWGGEVMIPCRSAEQAEALAEKLWQLAFTVRYSPDDPSKSWVDVSQFPALTGVALE